MTFWLVGTIEEKGCSGQGCPGCPFHITEDETYACMCEGCWSALYRAIDLWNLLKSDKGHKLFRLLKDEIEVEREDGSRIMTRGQIEQVLALLDGLEDALYTLTDKNWRIRPEQVDYVLQQNPSLVTSWQQDGQWVYTLSNTLGDVLGAAFFLKAALRLGREVEL